MAERYFWPSSAWIGAQHNCLSGRKMPYFPDALIISRILSSQIWYPRPLEPVWIIMVTCPSNKPKFSAAWASYISWMKPTSTKWLPLPKVPSWSFPLSYALSDTLSGSALSRQPPSSMNRRSSCDPYPFSTAHLAPFFRTFFNSSLVSFKSFLCDPSPLGMFM